MREYLDCAIFSTTCCDQWMDQWLKAYAGNRLQMHRLEATDTGIPASVSALAAASMRLRRFAACLLPVAEHNLACARTALAAATGILHTPVLALVRNLKAGALNVLCALGL